MRAFECFYRLWGDTGPGRTTIVIVPDTGSHYSVIGTIARHHNATVEDISDFSSIALNHLNTHVYKVS